MANLGQGILGKLPIGKPPYTGDFCALCLYIFLFIMRVVCPVCIQTDYYTKPVMERIRNDNWKNNEELRFRLKELVSQGLQRREILSYVRRDFNQYSWSLRTLDRRNAFLEIKRHDANISIDQIKDAVATELKGPGKLLGYRAMHLKIRQQHNLNVPREMVYVAMVDLDYNSVKKRRPGISKKKKKDILYLQDLIGFFHWTATTS